MSALLAGVTVWLLLPGLSSTRTRDLYEPRRRRRADPRGLITVLVPVACVLVLGWVVGAIVAVALTPVVRSTVASLETAGQRRRDEMLLRQLPCALDLVVAALDAGRPPVAALALVSESVEEPLAGELWTVAARLEAGGEPRAVWALLTEHQVLGPVGRAFARAESSGMPVARVVASVATEMRRARGAAARERGRRVGVRTAAPLTVCFLPAFFLVGVVPTIVGVVGSTGVLP